MNPAIETLIGMIPWLAFGGLALGAGGILASVHNTKLKIKNGYPLEGMWGQKLRPEMSSEAMERVKLLTQENAALRAEMTAAKERLAVVERIVTDKGFDVSRQIEQLREASPQLSDRSKN